MIRRPLTVRVFSPTRSIASLVAITAALSLVACNSIEKSANTQASRAASDGPSVGENPNRHQTGNVVILP